MIGSNKVACFVLVMSFGVTIAYSEERETVTVAEMLRVHTIVNAIADETANLRRRMNSEETTRVFLESVIEFQKRLNPIIASIAETDAPKEAQLYAVSLAIAVKETELAHWHYINAFLSGEQRYLNSGDVFLRESISEFARATSLAGGLAEVD